MQFQASSQMFPPYVLSSALSLITNLVSSFSKPKPRTNGPQKANLPWRLFLPTWFKNAFSQGNVGNSCLYCSVCEKMAFLQSSVALVMAAVSAGGRSSGCAFREKLLVHLSMAERKLGNRASFFFQVTVMARPP